MTILTMHTAMLEQGKIILLITNINVKYRTHVSQIIFNFRDHFIN